MEWRSGRCQTESAAACASTLSFGRAHSRISSSKRSPRGFPMTVSKVSRLSGDLKRKRRVSFVVSWKRTDLVLMYFPSLVFSLPEAAFSEPAGSMKLCAFFLLAKTASACPQSWTSKTRHLPPIKAGGLPTQSRCLTTIPRSMSSIHRQC